MLLTLNDIDSNMGTVSTAVQLLLLLSIGYIAVRWYLLPTQRPTLRSVAIVVLGDVGRSPRMMYHAESFAKNGFQTYIIGNRGTHVEPLSELHAEVTR